MVSLTREEKQVFGWLDTWWNDVSAWMEDPSPLTDSTWRAAVFQAGVIPDELHGLDLSPLKELLFAMVAYGDPSPENGSRLRKSELLSLSGKAWRVSQQIPRVIYERNERVSDSTELVGPSIEYSGEERRSGQWRNIMSLANGGEVLSRDMWSARIKGEKGNRIRVIKVRNQVYRVHTADLPDGAKTKRSRDLIIQQWDK